jgi:Putative prokaryotic signal transducing protein
MTRAKRGRVAQAGLSGDRKARFAYNGGMRAVLKTTDPVILNFATNLLSQEGIESVVFDTHASVMDGSMGFLPRRLMVLDEDFDRAEELLRAAVPEAM